MSPSLFCTSHPERRAPFADNRQNICRRVFLQGDLGTNPGSGEGGEGIDEVWNNHPKAFFRES